MWLHRKLPDSFNIKAGNFANNLRVKPFSRNVSDILFFCRLPAFRPLNRKRVVPFLFRHQHIHYLRRVGFQKLP
jgi:hypothetical protein